ncbi:MAG: hypothetical protein RBR22_01360 [Desulfuromonas sp.]|nr:hypothetical protein [Desulfuromonas sp.]
MTKLHKNDLIEALKDKAKNLNQEQSPDVDTQSQQALQEGLRKKVNQLLTPKNDSN